MKLISRNSVNCSCFEYNKIIYMNEWDLIDEEKLKHYAEDRRRLNDIKDKIDRDFELLDYRSSYSQVNKQVGFGDFISNLKKSNANKSNKLLGFSIKAHSKGLYPNAIQNIYPLLKGDLKEDAVRMQIIRDCNEELRELHELDNLQLQSRDSFLRKLNTLGQDILKYKERIEIISPSLSLTKDQLSIANTETKVTQFLAQKTEEKLEQGNECITSTFDQQTNRSSYLWRINDKLLQENSYRKNQTAEIRKEIQDLSEILKQKKEIVESLTIENEDMFKKMGEIEHSVQITRILATIYTKFIKDENLVLTLNRLIAQADYRSPKIKNLKKVYSKKFTLQVEAKELQRNSINSRYSISQAIHSHIVPEHKMTMEDIKIKRGIKIRILEQHYKDLDNDPIQSAERIRKHYKEYIQQNEMLRNKADNLEGEVNSRLSKLNELMKETSTYEETDVALRKGYGSEQNAILNNLASKSSGLVATSIDRSAHFIPHKAIHKMGEGNGDSVGYTTVNILKSFPEYYKIGGKYLIQKDIEGCLLLFFMKFKEFVYRLCNIHFSIIEITKEHKKDLSLSILRPLQLANAIKNRGLDIFGNSGKDFTPKLKFIPDDFDFSDKDNDSQIKDGSIDEQALNRSVRTLTNFIATKQTFPRNSKRMNKRTAQLQKVKKINDIEQKILDNLLKAIDNRSKIASTFFCKDDIEDLKSIASERDYQFLIKRIFNISYDRMLESFENIFRVYNGLIHELIESVGNEAQPFDLRSSFINSSPPITRKYSKVMNDHYKMIQTRNMKLEKQLRQADLEVSKEKASLIDNQKLCLDLASFNLTTASTHFSSLIASHRALTSRVVAERWVPSLQKSSTRVLISQLTSLNKLELRKLANNNPQNEGETNRSRPKKFIVKQGNRKSDMSLGRLRNENRGARAPHKNSRGNAKRARSFN